MFKRTHVLQFNLVLISADSASHFLHILQRKKTIMECSSDVETSCGILKNFQTTDSIFGWTNIYINTLCVIGYLHGKQTFLYYSYDQRNRSSPVQINIFFDPVHLKSDIYIANNPISISLMIKGITVHLFKCIYLI